MRTTYSLADAEISMRQKLTLLHSKNSWLQNRWMASICDAIGIKLNAFIPKGTMEHSKCTASAMALNIVAN